MSRMISTKLVLTVACIVGVFTNGIAFAHGGGHGGGGHGGHGGGHHSGGHHGGGHHYGGGHYYGGYRYGGYGGYGYGLGYGGYGGYGYGSTYYTQPVYTNYNQAICNQGTCLNPTVIGAAPVVISASQVARDGAEILLFSPPDLGRDVQYSLNGAPFIMKPGGVQSFSNDRTWTIVINSGNGQNLRYTLVPNRYKFKLTENGLGLFSTLDQPGVAGTAATGISSAPSATPAPAPIPVPGN